MKWDWGWDILFNKDNLYKIKSKGLKLYENKDRNSTLPEIVDDLYLRIEKLESKIK
jgi:hypothetical protein